MKLAQKLAIKYAQSRLRIMALVSKKKAAKKTLQLFSTPMMKPKTKTPAIFLKGEKLSFTIDGHIIRGHRWLPKQPPKEKILILHGFESNSRNFSAYINAFLKKGHEVLAFDAPAHGESGGKKITLPLYIQTIKEINERYGPIEYFMAHSFGGLALSHFIEQIHHDKGTKIVFIAPATETKTAADKMFRLLGLDGEVRKEFDKLIIEIAGKPQEHFSIRRAMNNIQASVLWVHDEEDDIVPISGALKVKEDKHRNVQFVFTKGLGHRKIYRDEGVMGKVVEWLAH